MTYHLSTFLLFVRVLQFSIHYPAVQKKKLTTYKKHLIRTYEIWNWALLLRVCGLPDAPQFVCLHGTIAGKLQQPLDIVEDGGLVVGQRKLYLPGCSQPSHLNTKDIIIII